MAEKKKGVRAVLLVGGALTGTALAIYLATKAKAVLPPEGPPVYLCPHCGAQFSSYSELLAHIEAEHPGETAPPEEEVPTTKFAYASDIRWEEVIDPARGFAVEVDVKNTGGNPATCHPIATLRLLRTYLEETYPEEITVDMGIKTINPGETVTFSGAWYYAWGPGEIPYSYAIQDITIESEAGVITLSVGVSPISVELPAKVVQGAPFWATTKIWLNYDMPNRFYNVEVVLRSQEAIDVDNYIRTFKDPAWTDKIGVKRVTSLPISAAIIGTAGMQFRQMLLNRSGQYTIKGFWSGSLMEGDYPITQEPGRAIFSLAQFGVYEIPTLALPIGRYDILISLYIGTWTWVDKQQGLAGYFAWGDLKVGEALIYPGISGLMNLQPGDVILPYATGGEVSASVDFVNSGAIPVTYIVEYGSDIAGYREVITFPPGRKTISFAFTIPPEWEGPIPPDIAAYKMATYGHLSRVTYSFGVIGLGHRVLDVASARVFLT